jgi:hypothetical protein
LAAVAGRLESRDAREAAARAATALTQAISKTTNANELCLLATGLAAVATWLEPRDASEAAVRAAAALTQAISKGTNERDLMNLAAGLSPLVDWLESRDAREAAAALIQAISKTTHPDALRSLLKDLTSLLSRVTVDTSRQRALPLATVLASASDPSGSLAALALLSPALIPLPPPLPAQDLVDLLKHPFCVGEARRVVLGQLSRHYQRPFADQWDFVRFASEQRLDLDLTTPPRRYQPGSSAAPGVKQP